MLLITCNESYKTINCEIQCAKSEIYACSKQVEVNSKIWIDCKATWISLICLNFANLPWVSLSIIWSTYRCLPTDFVDFAFMHWISWILPFSEWISSISWISLLSRHPKSSITLTLPWSSHSFSLRLARQQVKHANCYIKHCAFNCRQFYTS